METTCKADELEPSSTTVFRLPREPIVVINGLPPISPNNNNTTLAACEFHTNKGFGEWLIGRKVMKLFGDQFYNGKVHDFDSKTGWYRVVYEDGDFEDLEWNELEPVLRPLDITIPLKTLALKVLKKRQGPDGSSGKTVYGPRKCGKGKKQLRICAA